MQPVHSTRTSAYRLDILFLRATFRFSSVAAVWMITKWYGR